jgi:hypothetical protein
MRAISPRTLFGAFCHAGLPGAAQTASRRVGRLPVFLLLGAGVLTGCTMTVPLAKPAPSPFQYAERREAPIQVVVQDARPAGDRKLSRGRLPVEFTGAGEDLAFLRDAVVAEMKGRGINAVTETTGNADVLAIEVNRFYFRNRRMTGFSPWITFTNFRARVTYQGRAETVTSYFHAGKVPMWSMDEVVEPTYNYPWRVVVREVVTKLNRLYFKIRPPESVVQGAAGSLEGDASLDAILDAAFLGVPELLPRLETLVKTSPSGNVVVYALDAMGIIGDATSFPFLRDFYPTARERGQLFSLKAIGDLGTPDALSYVRSQSPGDDENLKELIDLYTY